MAKYLVSIFGDASEWDAMTAEQWTAHDAAHAAFAAEAGDRIIDGRQLESAPTATSLRLDAGGALAITDGPFLETKEALGGYYLLAAADLDEVLALVKLLPEVHASHSGVEIRPVVER